MEEKTQRWNWDDASCLTALREAFMAASTATDAALRLNRRFLPTKETSTRITAGCILGGIEREQVQERFTALFPGELGLLKKFKRKGQSPYSGLATYSLREDLGMPQPQPLGAPGFPESMLAECSAAGAVLRLDSCQCKFPFGDPGTPEFGFCESSALAGKSYCAQHAGIARGSEEDLKKDVKFAFSLPR